MNIIGFLSFVILIGMPVVVILLLLWTYKMKKNSEIQIEQNKRIIEPLENRVIESIK